jgi:hypothetical protein
MFDEKKDVKRGLFWHIHHDKLLEASNDIDDRIDYIKRCKPKDEIETRLRLLQPVKGALPEDVVSCLESVLLARDKWDETRKALDDANDEFRKVEHDFLHATFNSAERVPMLQAQTALDSARHDYYKAMATYDIASHALNTAIYKHEKEFRAMHKAECPNCPWNGLTIFPGKW